MQWIERLKMTHKLALVLAVPMLILGHLSLHRVMTAMEARHEAHHLGALARLGVAVGDMVHELQRERGASAGFLGSKGAKFQPELAAQRKRTDEKAAVLHTYLSGFDLEQYGADLQANLNEGLEHLGELQRIRSSVDGLNVPIGEVLEYYTDTNGHFLEVVPEMAKVSPNKDLAVATTAYAAFLQAKERAGIERAVLSNTFAANAFSPGMFEKFLKLVTTQDVYLAQFRALAAKPQLEFYDVTMKGEYVEETARMRKQAYEKAAGGGSVWIPSTGSRCSPGRSIS